MTKETPIVERCGNILRKDNITISKGDGRSIRPKLIVSVEEARKLVEKNGYNDFGTLKDLVDEGEKGESERRLKEKDPVAVVKLTRLEIVNPDTREYREVTIRGIELYDLSWLGLAHVITIGADKECDLRPFLRSLYDPESPKAARNCFKDLHTNRVPVDQEVSGLHSLMFWKRYPVVHLGDNCEKSIRYAEHPFYRDRSQFGSTLNDERSIMNMKHVWEDYFLDYIGIGPTLGSRDKRPVFKKKYPHANGNTKLQQELIRVVESKFKLRWVPYEFSHKRMRKMLD